MKSLRYFLKSSRHSVTPPRQSIFDYLQKHDNVTIQELILSLQPQVNQASIYRALNLFRKLGIIQDSVVVGKKIIELSDQFKAHHHHLSCLSCESATCIEDEMIERRLNELAEKHGFKPVSHQLGISGYCNKCKNRKEAPR